MGDTHEIDKWHSAANLQTKLDGHITKRFSRLANGANPTSHAGWPKNRHTFVRLINQLLTNFQTFSLSGSREHL